MNRALRIARDVQLADDVEANREEFSTARRSSQRAEGPAMGFAAVASLADFGHS
jgi:hypothetical protein